MLSFIYFNGGSEFIHNNESRIFFLQVHLFFLGLAVEGPVFLRLQCCLLYISMGVQNSFTTMNHVFIYIGPAVFLRFGSRVSSFVF